MNTWDKYRQKIADKAAEYRTATQHRKRCKSLAIDAISCVEDTEDAQCLLQQIAQGIQENAHKQIAGVVSKCLSIVFDEPYEFCISFERKRGRTEAALSFKRNNQHVDPMTASGGGVVDVAAFALRLACLSLSRPKLRRVLVMDEPFKFVSEQYRDRVRSMIETLAEEMEVQFIMVTHIPELVCGKVIRL